VSSLEIVAAALDLVGRAERLTRLEPDELRRRAVAACRDADVAALWDITEAHLLTHGRKGARVSPRTLETYQDSVQQFVRWALPAGVSLLRPKPPEAFAYVRHLEASGLRPSSVQVRLSGARSLYAALRWSGATDGNPFADVRAARDPRAAWEKRGPYSEQDVEALLAQADRQELVAVLLAADCGLRNSELLAVERTDLRLDEEAPHVMVHGKGRAGLPDLPPDHPYLLIWRTWKPGTCCGTGTSPAPRCTCSMPGGAKRPPTATGDREGTE
jgi:integrase/recombinase XerC